MRRRGKRAQFASVRAQCSKVKEGKGLYMRTTILFEPLSLAIHNLSNVIVHGCPGPGELRSSPTVPSFASLLLHLDK